MPICCGATCFEQGRCQRAVACRLAACGGIWRAAEVLAALHTSAGCARQMVLRTTTWAPGVFQVTGWPALAITSAVPVRCVNSEMTINTIKPSGMVTMPGWLNGTNA